MACETASDLSCIGGNKSQTQQVMKHLYNREEGIQAVQVSASRLHRHADDGQGRESRHHSGQVGCAACPGNDHLRSRSPADAHRSTPQEQGVLPVAR